MATEGTRDGRLCSVFVDVGLNCPWRACQADTRAAAAGAAPPLNRRVAVRPSPSSCRCPDPQCKAPLPPSALQRLLTAEEFARWEQLTLQRTLDSMPGGVWDRGGVTVERLASQWRVLPHAAAHRVTEPPLPATPPPRLCLQMPPTAPAAPPSASRTQTAARSAQSEGPGGGWGTRAAGAAVWWHARRGAWVEKGVAVLAQPCHGFPACASLSHALCPPVPRPQVLLRLLLALQRGLAPRYSRALPAIPCQASFAYMRAPLWQPRSLYCPSGKCLAQGNRLD